MKNIKCLVMILIISMGMGLVYSEKTVSAASASVNISADKTDPEKDQSITVKVNVKADSDISGVEIYFLYDEKVLEFQKSGKLINGGNGLLKLSDMDSSNIGRSKEYTIKFKAIGVGVSEVSVNEKAYVYDYEEGNEMSVSANRLSISVKSKNTASDNADLSVLKIDKGDLVPEFKKDVTEYSTEVENDVESLVINALAEDSKSTVDVSGNGKFAKGENKVVIRVKAESGKTKEYIIKVNKRVESEVTETKEPDVNIDSDPEDRIEDFSVEIIEGKTFIKNAYSFEVVDVEDSSLVPAGYLKTKVILYGVSITAYTKENDLDNDFLLIYAINNFSGEKGFYQYDRVEKTMQRYQTGKSGTVSISGEEEAKIITSEEYNSRLNQLSVIIAVLSSIIALLIIGIIRLFMKARGIKTDEDFD